MTVNLNGPAADGQSDSTVTPPAAEAPVTPAPTPTAPAASAPVAPAATTSTDDTTDDLVGDSFTKEQVTKIVAARYARLKDDAIKAKAAELSATALAEAENAKNSLAELSRELEVLKLAQSKDVRVDLLLKSKLSGTELVEFAELLESSNGPKAPAPSSVKPATNPIVDRLNNSVKSGPAADRRALIASVADQIRGDK